ncbi:MAG: gamma-glutamyltransferase [Tepidisphaerales bacterium]
MVVTVHPLATRAGLDALAAGGNAVDAAVAAALMLGVVDGHNSGIGGGCFLLMRTAGGQLLALDGREMAPAAAGPELYLRDGKPDTRLSQTGPLAVGVPGSLAVFDEAVRRCGRLTLAAALEAAADVAERGFPIDANYARKLRATAPLLRQFPETARVLLKPDGSPLLEGDVLKQPDLARTYRAIARHGVGWFYGGAFASAVESWMRAHGGVVTADDFARYVVKQRQPIVTTYRGVTVVGFPPPSSGGVHVAQLLNILEQFDVAGLHRRDEATRVHVTAEAMRRVFADRAAYLGDSDFVPVPRGLLDKEYARQLAAQIDLERASAGVAAGQPPDRGVFGDGAAEKHTTHIAAMDSDGNVVAITTTVNTGFGSKVIVPGTGVILNNQMDDFALAPGVANAFGLVGQANNAVAPGKRPLSSMSPTLVFDGHGTDGPLRMTLGAAGGPRIISQVVLGIVHVVDLGDDLASAMRRPRLHHQGGTLWLERGIAPPWTDDLFTSLRRRGHELELSEPSGAMNAIARDADGAWVGVAEPRLDGAAGWVDRPSTDAAKPRP